MAHPKVTKRLNGKLWHLEDSELKKVEAQSLRTHLIKTEDKLSRISKTKDGYRVWWARK